MSQTNGKIVVLLSPLQAFYFITKVSDYYSSLFSEKEKQEIKNKILGRMVEVIIGGELNGSIRAVGYDRSFRELICGTRNQQWKPEELKYLCVRGGIKEVTM